MAPLGTVLLVLCALYLLDIADLDDQRLSLLQRGGQVLGVGLTLGVGVVLLGHH